MPRCLVSRFGVSGLRVKAVTKIHNRLLRNRFEERLESIPKFEPTNPNRYMLSRSTDSYIFVCHVSESMLVWVFTAAKNPICNTCFMLLIRQRQRGTLQSTASPNPPSVCSCNAIIQSELSDRLTIRLIACLYVQVFHCQTVCARAICVACKPKPKPRATRLITHPSSPGLNSSSQKVCFSLSVCCVLQTKVVMCACACAVHLGTTVARKPSKAAADSKSGSSDVRCDEYPKNADSVFEEVDVLCLLLLLCNLSTIRCSWLHEFS
jgi:hypothetical protein